MNVETLLSAMKEASAERFSRALKTLERFEADEAILKSELVELRTYGLNRGFEAAWEAWVQEPFLFAGQWEKLSEHERKLSQITPAVHTAAGCLKRIRGAVKADGAFRNRMIEVLEVLVPIAARAEALKAKIGKRPPKVTKTSIERNLRDAKAMTCQICGRDILAEQGVIAHHGYTRPGIGWQTSSCEGARHVPFETSRDTLTDHLVAVRGILKNKEIFLENVKAEKVSLNWSFSDRSQCEKPWQSGVQRHRAVTRKTFEGIKAETAPLRKIEIEKDTTTFDILKRDTILRMESEITETIYYIEKQQKRHDAWKGPTHRFDGDTWVPLSPPAPNVQSQDGIDEWLEKSTTGTNQPES